MRLSYAIGCELLAIAGTMIASAEVKTVRGAEEKRGTSQSEMGLVRIAIAASEPWSGLVSSGTEVPGALVLWEGGRSLAPED